jgi:hypothetical protein
VIHLEPAQARWVTLAVRIPPETAQATAAGAHPIHFDIGLVSVDVSGKIISGATLSEKSTFVVPR